MRRAICFLLSIASAMASGPEFNEKGELRMPADYREWVYLSSGLGMTYGPAAANATLQNPMFDNVFVTREAFTKFQESGKWPDGSMFVLEIRYSTSQGSINKGGFFQTDVAALEVAVKDTKRFPQGWGYFDFGGGLMPRRTTASPLPVNAGCQACHSANGAVEQTFTQFYPTALEIAEKKGTLRTSYQAPAPSPVRLFHSIQAAKTDPSALLDETRSAQPDSAALSERNLNMMGYTLMQEGRNDHAIAVFRWIAAQHPKSANALDSLSEALETANRHTESLQAATRALAVIEEDASLPASRKDALRKGLMERRQRLTGK
ncbi:MAG: cytochrome P460 family protein [Bryobacterales bacterium]|nr:cytochrome P460 family protein [Bryobacterales bacterium]